LLWDYMVNFQIFTVYFILNIFKKVNSISKSYFFDHHNPKRKYICDRHPVAAANVEANDAPALPGLTNPTKKGDRAGTLKPKTVTIPTVDVRTTDMHFRQPA